MKFQSQIITSGSGSVGGCTFSRNRSGQYVRRRAMPVNPGSTQQAVMQAAFATLVARWTSTLTQAQRDAWDLWAFNTPQFDSLGQAVTITGQNAYIKMNTFRMQSTLAIVDVAPAVFAGAALTPPGIASATASTDVLSITFVNGDAWATAVGGFLSIFVSRPQNPSVLFFKGPYRLGGVILGAGTPPTSPQPITSPFPFVVNQRIHIQSRAGQADARISTAFRASKISV